jgi:hypothetical protein
MAYTRKYMDPEDGERGERFSVGDKTQYIPQYLTAEAQDTQRKPAEVKPAKPQKPAARPTDGVKLFRDSLLFVLGTSAIVALGIVCIRLLMALWAVL